MSVERIALDLGNFELESTGLARTVGGSKSASTPRRATVDLREICYLLEGAGIAEGHIGDAMMGESREARHDCGLLPTTRTTSGDEHASVLSVQLSTLPEAASGIPEGLPLSWHVTVAGGDTDDEAIELSDIVGGEDGVTGFRRRIHLGQDLLRESLGDLVDSGATTGSLDAPLLSFGQLGDVAVESVNDDCNVGSHG